jgi:hypothetical protein
MKKIIVEPFNFPIFSFKDKEKCQKWVKLNYPNETKLIEDLDNVFGIFYQFPGPSSFLLFYNNNTTLDHELIHATWYILNYAGIEIDSNNHEIQAYLFEHIKRLLTT